MDGVCSQEVQIVLVVDFVVVVVRAGGGEGINLWAVVGLLNHPPNRRPSPLCDYLPKWITNTAECFNGGIWICVIDVEPRNNRWTH